MKKLNKKLTIIKYGSNTLVTKNVNWNISIDYNNMQNHWLVINSIKNPVIIVSSGAVAFWKSLNNNFEYIQDDIVKKRVFAALWNPLLSINWDKYISDKLVLQGLVTHRDLNSSSSKENIKNIIYSVFNQEEQKTVIQINDNDFITDEELVKFRNGAFGDNDELTKLLAILCSEIFEEIEVIINTSSDGVLENNKLLTSIKAEKLTDSYIGKICNLDKTNLWTGGMTNKLKEVSSLLKNTNNTTVHIINGKKAEQLKNIINWKNAGTKIFK